MVDMLVIDGVRYRHADAQRLGLLNKATVGPLHTGHVHAPWPTGEDDGEATAPSPDEPDEPGEPGEPDQPADGAEVKARRPANKARRPVNKARGK